MNPMRFNTSCPDCGYVEDELEKRKRRLRQKGFDCPRCGAHYTEEDFLNHLNEKRQAQYHNHAKADLTDEEL